MNGLRFVVRRVISTIPVLIMVALITFVILNAAPGDPAVVAAGADASPEQIEAARERLGLNDPLVTQFVNWMSNVVRGDLGESFRGESVVAMILRGLPVTLTLTVGALVVGLVIAIPAGIIAAVRSGSRTDRSIIVFTSLGISAPEFFVGLMAVLVLSLNLGWFPATGFVPFGDDPIGWLKSITLPSITLGVGVAAELTRHVRASMNDVLKRDYILTARSKGLSGTAVLGKHAMKNALLPVVTVLGLQVRRLLGGTVVVEQIFAINGIGTLAVRSVFFRDLPVLLGVALVTATVVLIVNLFVDLSYGYLDPKVRAG